ncbi:MAG: ComEC/Rec2 family competence protein [bacterium]
MNNKFFYSLIAGFTGGIFLSSFFKLGFSFFLFLLILSILIFIFGKFFAKEKTLILLLALFVFSFSSGILRYEIKDIRNEDKNLTNLAGEKVVLKGIVTDEPSVKDQSVQLTVLADFIATSSQDVKTFGKVLVTVGLFPAFKYGDLIQVEGKLERPTNFSTATSSDFDYVSFLAKDDIFYQISFAQAKVISSGHGSVLKNKLFAFKNYFISKINLLIKEPESSLLNGLILGAKNSLGKDLQNDFRLAGVSHIVALSGYNITIVAVGIMSILSFLPWTFSLSFGVLGILAFTIMTGGTATVVRASIMALLVLLAKGTHRKYDISRALLLAGFFMLIQNPKILVFDISFQLSFLSTLALILISPIIEKKMTFITEKYQLRELIVATISTQIFVLPFILYEMGLISVFSLFTNILILPIIPAIMFLGFLTGVLAFCSTFLAIPIAFICSLLLSYVLKIIYIFSHLPFSSITINHFPLILLILVYSIFFIIIWRAQNFSKIKDYDQY